MKRSILLLFSLLVLTACKSDDSFKIDSKNENDNFLKVGNKNIQLQSGSLQNLGVFKEDISDFVLNLFSSDFKFSNGKPKFEDSLTSGITVDLYVKNPSQLVLSSYKKVSYQEISDNSFEALNIAINYDFKNEKGITRRITQGTINVLKVGPEYEFEFSGIDNKGEKVVFFYRGKLLEINSGAF